jgi:hypothetical protein
MNVISEISGSHGDIYEDGCLLGCCAINFALFCTRWFNWHWRTTIEILLNFHRKIHFSKLYIFTWRKIQTSGSAGRDEGQWTQFWRHWRHSRRSHFKFRWTRLYYITQYCSCSVEFGKSQFIQITSLKQCYQWKWPRPYICWILNYRFWNWGGGGGAVNVRYTNMICCEILSTALPAMTAPKSFNPPPPARPQWPMYAACTGFS